MIIKAGCWATLCLNSPWLHQYGLKVRGGFNPASICVWSFTSHVRGWGGGFSSWTHRCLTPKSQTKTQRLHVSDTRGHHVGAGHLMELQHRWLVLVDQHEPNQWQIPWKTFQNKSWNKGKITKTVLTLGKSMKHSRSHKRRLICKYWGLVLMREVLKAAVEETPTGVLWHVWANMTAQVPTKMTKVLLTFLPLKWLPPDDL